MHPLLTTVLGSRYPLLAPLPMREPSTSGSTASEPETPQPAFSTSVPSSSGIRRKPTLTYKSISAHESIDLSVEDSRYPNGVSGIHDSQKSAAKRKHCDIEPYTPTVRVTGPPLPLYHPQGGLALSLPELDPGEFGLPNTITIDDNDDRLRDNDPSRRASSRARRPAAKLREGGDEELLNGTSVAGTKVLDAQVRSTSPRKRRAGGGGGKRRRKEVEDVDGTYPNPPKRTRNLRATVAGAVASPLAGPVTAVDDVELDASAVQDVPDVDEARSEILDVPEPKLPTRPRRKAPAHKRRGSSASDTTTTSMSISIAANTRRPRLPAPSKAEEDPEINIPLAQRSHEQEEEPSAANGGDVEQEQEQEQAMELSTPPERVSPPDVSLDTDTIDAAVTAPKETVEETVHNTTTTESSTTAKEVDDPKPAELPLEPSADDESQSATTQANVSTEADSAPVTDESTKEIIDTPIAVQAPVESKALETQPPLPEPKIVSSPARQADKVISKPPDPSPVEEKEEGELSEDG